MLLVAGLLVPGVGLTQAAPPAPVPPPAPDAQARLPPGAAAFGQACAECHGANGEGGAGPPLRGPVFKHGGDPESLTNSIRHGYPPNMPPFKATLSEAQIKSVVDFLTRTAQGPRSPALLPNSQGHTMPGS